MKGRFQARKYCITDDFCQNEAYGQKKGGIQSPHLIGSQRPPLICLDRNLSFPIPVIEKSASDKCGYSYINRDYFLFIFKNMITILVIMLITTRVKVTVNQPIKTIWLENPQKQNG